MHKTLFSAGTSRGGTTFFARMLSVHPAVKMASDPYLPLFKQLYTSILKKGGITTDPNLPLSDYYYSQKEIEKLDWVQSQNLEIPFPAENLEGLQKACQGRMLLAAKEAAPYIDTLAGENYRTLFESGMQILRKAYGIDETTYCGFNDNWVSEFFPLLANAFPESKFLFILRDPRACMASLFKAREKYPELVPFIYSFLRCWRKHAALGLYFQSLPLFKNRLYLLRYEDLAKNPEGEAKKICTFLDIPYEAAMLNTQRFRPLSGESWSGYSHFDNTPKEGIYATGIDNWKKHLDPVATEFIEFVTLPEMNLCSYEPLFYKGGAASEKIEEFYKKEEKVAKGWRLKHESCEKELERENFRYELLGMKEMQKEKLRENFLFLETHAAIVGKRKLFAPL